jgi:rSAM/selenodomain-associated transferase 2
MTSDFGAVMGHNQAADRNHLANPGRFPTISVVIPALNEAAVIAATIRSAQDPAVLEVIVADGGSWDETVTIAEAHGARVVHSPRGRAFQMNRGADAAAAPNLLFLHADTLLPPGFGAEVARLLSLPTTSCGAFTLHIDSPLWSLRLIERIAGWRAKLLSLPYGDQALFTTAQRFRELGGFPELPFMEDFAFVRALAGTGRVAISPLPVQTSARRWEQAGPWRTTLANQLSVLGFQLGVPAGRLAARYRRFTRSQ